MCKYSPVHFCAIILVVSGIYGISRQLCIFLCFAYEEVETSNSPCVICFPQIPQSNICLVVDSTESLIYLAQVSCSVREMYEHQGNLPNSPACIFYLIKFLVCGQFQDFLRRYKFGDFC